MKPLRGHQLSLFTSSHEIDVRRAAKYIGTSARTIHRLLESGELHGYRLTAKGWWKISYDSVVAYINRVKHTYLPDSPPVTQLSIPKTENAPTVTGTTRSA